VKENKQKEHRRKCGGPLLPYPATEAGKGRGEGGGRREMMPLMMSRGRAAMRAETAVEEVAGTEALGFLLPFSVSFDFSSRAYNVL
jgi:hypothetical protein